MNSLVLVFAMALLATECRCTPCCPGENPNLKKHKCQSDNEPPQFVVDCPYAIFVIETADDVSVTPDGHLNVSHELLAPESFCTAWNEDANDTLVLLCEEFLEDEPSAKLTWLRVYSICVCVSAVFLLATLLVYCLLPGLRDLQGKTLMAGIFSLLLGFVWLAIIQLHNFQDQSNCTANAFIMYFWMLSAFAWTNIVAFNVWKSVMHVLNVSDNRLFPFYCMYGWGVPLLFLSAALITDHVPGSHLRPNFGKISCWFGGPLETWGYFYGPAAVIVCANIVFFLWSCWLLWAGHRGLSTLKVQSLRFKCLLYFKLFMIMGIAWIFEVISFAIGSEGGFWLVTDLFNCLQGVIIFVVVVCRKRVLRQIQEYKPLGISLPSAWGQGTDHESETMLAEDAEVPDAFHSTK